MTDANLQSGHIKDTSVTRRMTANQRAPPLICLHQPITAEFTFTFKKSSVGLRIVQSSPGPPSPGDDRTEDEIRAETQESAHTSFILRRTRSVQKQLTLSTPDAPQIMWPVRTGASVGVFPLNVAITAPLKCQGQR
ncbi:hypothetical protein JOB18_007612 [Solea senegalensis]|uniref:Uncharacterized protein n=1 Tax=Solea senegalensis TaxID=28829 RepID=A0AAV6QR15_SOLSE|nr:hypothetical protein JOB18_007612 [Solea senegalensis]